MFIENGLCHISFPDGKMTLVMNKFFPAPQQIIRKLFLKTIALNWEDRCQITEEILGWLRRETNEQNVQESLNFYANAYANARTEINELFPRIERQERRVQEVKDYMTMLPRGHKKEMKPELDKKKATLKELRDRLHALRQDARHCKSEFNKINSNVEKFKANIELIEQLTADWR